MNYAKIHKMTRDLAVAKRDYLVLHGWSCTCNTPGSYWMWRRDFATEDAVRHARWIDRGSGPLGWPSEPRPYGIVMASADLAVEMTARELDPKAGV
jgi:hypothetical protein